LNARLLVEEIERVLSSVHLPGGRPFLFDIFFFRPVPEFFARAPIHTFFLEVFELGYGMRVPPLIKLPLLRAFPANRCILRSLLGPEIDFLSLGFVMLPFGSPPYVEIKSLSLCDFLFESLITTGPNFRYPRPAEGQALFSRPPPGK